MKDHGYSTTLFERLKLLSIKPGMLNILFHKFMGENPESKMDADRFIKENNLSGWNAEIIPMQGEAPNTPPSMAVNIIEASLKESTGQNSKKGGRDNGETGLGLIKIMEEKQYPTEYKMIPCFLPEDVKCNDDSTYELIPELKIDRERKKKVSQFKVDSRWRDLYTSWNLLFVISNFGTDFLWLKLVLPTVFSAEAANYKEVRLISLFLFANLYLWRIHQKKSLFC